MQELHRAGGERDSILEGAHEVSHALGLSTKQYLHRNLGYTYLGVLEGLLGRQRSTIVPREGKDIGIRSLREY